MLNLTLTTVALIKARHIGKTEAQIKAAVMALLAAHKINDYEANYILNNLGSV
jgi:hypothetical protein